MSDANELEAWLVSMIDGKNRECPYRLAYERINTLTSRLGESVKASNYWQERFAEIEKALDTACVKDQEQKARLHTAADLAVVLAKERDSLAYRLVGIAKALDNQTANPIAAIRAILVEKRLLKSGDTQ